MLHKKQAFDLFDGICKLNEVVWNNPKGSYDDATEAAYQIEEALEGLNIQKLSDTLNFPIVEGTSPTPKMMSRYITLVATSNCHETCCKVALDDVDRFDKALDAIYFAVGSMHKLGLTPEQIVEGLQVVHDANVMKGSVKDSEGKIVKPDQWEELFAPEPKLQAILDKR